MYEVIVKCLVFTYMYLNEFLPHSIRPLFNWSVCHTCSKVRKYRPDWPVLCRESWMAGPERRWPVLRVCHRYSCTHLPGRGSTTSHIQVLYTCTAVEVHIFHLCNCTVMVYLICTVVLTIKTELHTPTPQVDLYLYNCTHMPSSILRLPTHLVEAHIFCLYNCTHLSDRGPTNS